MDRRTQRAVLLILFFGVAIVLYRSLGSSDYAVPRNGGAVIGKYDELDLTGLEPANATLGVYYSYALEQHAFHANRTNSSGQ